MGCGTSAPGQLKNNEPIATEPSETPADTEPANAAAAVPPAHEQAVKSATSAESAAALATAAATVIMDAAPPVMISTYKPKCFVIYYSMYGHVRTLVDAVAKGARQGGLDVELYQVPETLPNEVLEKMSAPPKADDPVISTSQLSVADCFIFGFPTRFGAMCAQMKSFFDATGSLWKTQGLVGKPATLIVSTATQGGGQETTVLTAATLLAHHGMIFVPTGYVTDFGAMADNSEVRGGSAYGMGTLADGDGSRRPSKRELELSEKQGAAFAKYAGKLCSPDATHLA